MDAFVEAAGQQVSLQLIGLKVVALPVRQEVVRPACSPSLPLETHLDCLILPYYYDADDLKVGWNSSRCFTGAAGHSVHTRQLFDVMPPCTVCLSSFDLPMLHCAWKGREEGGRKKYKEANESLWNFIRSSHPGVHIFLLSSSFCHFKETLNAKYKSLRSRQLLVCFWRFLCSLGAWFNFEVSSRVEILQGQVLFSLFTILVTSTNRVSNELGANRPKETKFAVVVAVCTSVLIGAIFMAAVFIWRTSLPRVFTDSKEVIHGASRLGYLLAATVFMSSIWPVLSGVAVGAGWQVPVAFINVGCYYLVGIPLGIMFGFKLKFGTLGIWLGMLTGTLLQMFILLTIIFRTKWDKQGVLAQKRMEEFGGKNEKLPLMEPPHMDDKMAPTDERILSNGSQNNVELVGTNR